MLKVLHPHPTITIAMLLCLLAMVPTGLRAGDTPAEPQPLLKPSAGDIKRLGKLLDQDKDFVTASRGPLTGTVVQRCILDAVESSDVICRLPSRDRGSSPTVITWIIDDGSMVKKGEKVVEFSHEPLTEHLSKQKSFVARAEAEKKRTSDVLKRIKNEAEIDIKLAQLDQRLAEIALQRYKGNDPLEKEALAIQLDRAKLLVERIKLQASPKIDRASDIVKTKDSALEEAIARQKDIEKEIAKCIVTAPQSGTVVHHAADKLRDPQGLAVGHPVHECQVLFTIFDPARIAVNARVPGGEAYKVRPGQRVDVQVDALLNQIHTGKVDFMMAVAKQHIAQITINGDNTSLKPGLTGEVTIVVGEQPNCLRLPTSAILGKGQDTFCYVRSGDELHVRKLTVGLSDGKLSEIQSGLKDNEPVLLDPAAVAKRLTAPAPGKKPADRKRQSRILLQRQPQYDFQRVVECLKAREDPRSPLARAVGSKGYHARQFADGPHPAS